MFRSVEALGFRVTHLYGATESYGPATACVFLPEWSALPDDERFAKMAGKERASSAIIRLLRC